MMILNGHYDGKRVVLDEPVPASVEPETRVRIVFESEVEEHVLARIAKLALPSDDLPSDFAEQHEHYVKGAPRK